MNESPVRSARVVIVDQDERVSGPLRQHLTQEGFEVSLAPGAAALSRLLLFDTVDLIVLDRVVSGEDGLAICRRMRAAHDRTPIIMVSTRAEDDDRISGLEAGADDYVGKPFNPRELVARMKAVLRRRPPASIPRQPAVDEAASTFGPFTIDVAAGTLLCHGEEVPMTTGDFAMLAVLVRHPRQTLSRDRLAKLAYGRSYGEFDRSLDVQISRLRKALQRDADSPSYIQTVWGAGYVFIPEGQASDAVRQRGRRSALGLPTEQPARSNTAAKPDAPDAPDARAAASRHQNSDRSGSA